MDAFKQILVSQILPGPTGLNPEEIDPLIEVPPEIEMGEYAFPCFVLARRWRKAPQAVAGEIVKKIVLPEEFESVRQDGPYLNFALKGEVLFREILEKICDAGIAFGSSREGMGKSITVDYSSPNIAKPFHVGHLRSTVIGNALCNIFSFLGYRIIGINHLGDWGTQFGAMICAFRKWGTEEMLQKDPIRNLMNLYVQFHQEAERNPDLQEEARKEFRLLEEGNQEEEELWKRINRISLDEYKRIYARLGISFDLYMGESFFNDKIDKTIERIQAARITEWSEGALVVKLEEKNLPPALLRKADGATLYLTRDICAALYRKETFDFAKNLYVVGVPQTLHFRQMVEVLKKMGFSWAEDCVHISFGHVQGLSTRKGAVIFLDDVLNEAVEKAERIIQEKNPGLPNKKGVAEYVGIGAIIFNDLKNKRIKDISFSWDEVLNFDGETGPYLQYTHARICSILRKAERAVKKRVKFSRLRTLEERKLVRLLDTFPAKVNEAATAFEPSTISGYLLELSSTFNHFYNQHRVLGSDEELTDARLSLTASTGQVLRNGLILLGIQPLEEM